jgi:hypothetical protein
MINTKKKKGLKKMLLLLPTIGSDGRSATAALRGRSRGNTEGRRLNCKM